MHHLPAGISVGQQYYTPHGRLKCTENIRRYTCTNMCVYECAIPLPTFLSDNSVTRSVDIWIEVANIKIIVQ